MAVHLTSGEPHGLQIRADLARMIPDDARGTGWRRLVAAATLRGVLDLVPVLPAGVTSARNG